MIGCDRPDSAVSTLAVYYPTVNRTTKPTDRVVAITFRVDRSDMQYRI